MTRYTTPGGSMTVLAEQLAISGPVLVWDSDGHPTTDYGMQGDYLVTWSDSSTSVIGEAEFTQTFSRLAPGPQPRRQESHAR